MQKCGTKTSKTKKSQSCQQSKIGIEPPRMGATIKELGSIHET
jgi:hypothetical protein